MKIRIQKYDPAVLEAPFQFITLHEYTLSDSEERIVNGSDDGVATSSLWRKICQERGESYRFWSMSSAVGFDFDITVRGELEDIKGIW